MGVGGLKAERAIGFRSCFSRANRDLFLLTEASWRPGHGVPNRSLIYTSRKGFKWFSMRPCAKTLIQVGRFYFSSLYFSSALCVLVLLAPRLQPAVPLTWSSPYGMQQYLIRL